MSFWLTTAVALLLAGSVVSALIASHAGQRRRRSAVLTGTYVLWSTAGALAIAAMATAVLRLINGGLSKQAVALAAIESIVGLLVTTVAVCLLGYFGFWSTIRRGWRRILDQRP